MKITAIFKLGAISVIGLALGGCASLQSDAGFRAVAQTAKDRLGNDR